MNLFERIERKLGDEATKIEHRLFEQAATYFLEDVYPSLVPVEGGTDHGRDADIVVPGQAPTRVLVTSARTYEGARKNLVNSLSSLLQHQMEGREVVLACLAELNHQKKVKLQELAAEKGFRLTNVFDRAFFTQRLVRDGEWRKRLLGLPGGPFSLSKVSGYAAPCMPSGQLVGRDSLVEKLASLDGDAVVWGPPGVGKSSVLTEVPELYFVAGSPSAERLLDDVLSTSPEILAVDDAAGRLEVLETLQHIRRVEGLTFKIYAVCWPHQVRSILARLPGAEAVKVGLLTRPEIREIAEAKGLWRYRDLGMVLNQARGRPGWACRLSDLAAGGEWRSVATGRHLRSEAHSYLERAGIGAATLRTLAIVAALGGVRREDISKLAMSLGLPRTGLAEQLQQVAVGGLLDVVPVQAPVPSELYSVEPQALASNLVGEFFFGEVVPTLTVEELCDGWPERRLEIATATTIAVLLGYKNALHSAHSFFRYLAADPSPSEEYRVFLRNYVHLGRREAEEVLELVIGHLVEHGPGKIAVFSAEIGAQFIADACVNVGYKGAYRFFLSVARALARDREELGDFVRETVDEIVAMTPEGDLHVDALVKFWECIAESSDLRGSDMEIAVLLLKETMKPVRGGAWQQPDDARAVTFGDRVLDPLEMRRLWREVWEDFVGRDLVLARAHLESSASMVAEWGSVARGELVVFGGAASEEQMEVASETVVAVATWIYERSDRYPGLRALVRHHARGVCEFPSESDALVNALFSVREEGADWRAFSASRKGEVEAAIQPFLHRPEELMALLSGLSIELATVSELAVLPPLALIFEVLLDLTDDSAEWFMAAREAGYQREAGGLLTRALIDDELPPSALTRLLEEPASRRRIIGEAFRRDQPRSELGTLAFGALVPEDAVILEFLAAGQLFPHKSVESLLSHPDRAVRSAVALTSFAALSRDGSKFDPECYEGTWKKAIADLQFPLNPKPRSAARELFRRLATVAPIEFETVFSRAARDAGSRLDFLRSEFAEAAATLPPRNRTRLWEELSKEKQKLAGFRALAGHDREWIETQLAEGKVDPEFLLAFTSFYGGVLPVKELAKLLVPRGCDPLSIAATLQYGMLSGSELEVIARQLKDLRELTQSPNPDVRAVGKAGIPFFERAYEEAEQEARRKEIVGKL